MSELDLNEDRDTILQFVLGRFANGSHHPTSASEASTDCFVRNCLIRLAATPWILTSPKGRAPANSITAVSSKGVKELCLQRKAFRHVLRHVASELRLPPEHAGTRRAAPTSFGREIRTVTPGEKCTVGSPSGSGSPAARVSVCSKWITCAAWRGHGGCSTRVYVNHPPMNE